MPIDHLTPDPEETETMEGALFDKLHEHAMASLEQLGNRMMNDATTVSKAADYDHLIFKNQVTLASAIGARELASERNPGGPKKPDAA